MRHLTSLVVHIPIALRGVAWGRVRIVSSLSVILLMVSGCAEPYPIWKKLDDAPFPVTVNAMVTGHRNILSRQQALTYEGWRVSFGTESPTAMANADCSWRVRCEVEIQHLRCETGTGGAEDCSMHLDTLDEACELAIARSRQKVGIICPVDILFDGDEGKLSAMRAR